MKGRSASNLELPNPRIPIARRCPINNLKYVGMDVHKATIVMIVLNVIGQFEKQVIIKTTTEAIRDFFKSQEGALHVIFEEGTQSSWFYELIKPLVAELSFAINAGTNPLDLVITPTPLTPKN